MKTGEWLEVQAQAYADEIGAEVLVVHQPPPSEVCSHDRSIGYYLPLGDASPAEAGSAGAAVKRPAAGQSAA